MVADPSKSYIYIGAAYRFKVEQGDYFYTDIFFCVYGVRKVLANRNARSSPVEYVTKIAEQNVLVKVGRLDLTG